MSGVQESESGAGHFEVVDRETKKAAKAVIKVIKDDLHGPVICARGYVYVVQEAKKSHIKIGFSKDENGSRSAAPLKFCKFELVERHHTPYFVGAHRCEAIVHALLPRFRVEYKECACNKAKKHREWFAVGARLEEILKIVELVYHWVSSDPYNSAEGGKLREIWSTRLNSLENSLNTAKPEAFPHFFERAKKAPDSCEFEWKVFETQLVQTPRKNVTFFRYELLGSFTPGRIDESETASSRKKSGRLLIEQTPIQQAKSRLLSPSSTPSKQPTRTHLLSSIDGEKTSQSSSTRPKIPKKKEILLVKQSSESQNSDNRRSYSKATPSKTGSEKKSNVKRKSRSPYREKGEDSDEGFVVDDDEYDDGEEDYTDHHDDDDDQTQCGDGSEYGEKVADEDSDIDHSFKSMAGLSLTERFALVKIGYKHPAPEQQAKANKNAGKIKASEGRQPLTSKSLVERSADDSDSALARGKGRHDLGLSRRTAKGPCKSVPKFRVDAADDSISSSGEEAKTVEVYGDKSGKCRPKKPTSKHCRGPSMIESDARSLAKGDPVVRPNSSAERSAANVFALAGQLGKLALSGTDAKINLNVTVNYGTTYHQ